MSFSKQREILAVRIERLEAANRLHGFVSVLAVGVGLLALVFAVYNPPVENLVVDERGSPIQPEWRLGGVHAGHLVAESIEVRHPSSEYVTAVFERQFVEFDRARAAAASDQPRLGFVHEREQVFRRRID